MAAVPSGKERGVWRGRQSLRSNPLRGSPKAASPPQPPFSVCAPALGAQVGGAPVSQEGWQGRGGRGGGGQDAEEKPGSELPARESAWATPGTITEVSPRGLGELREPGETTEGGF